MNNRNIFLLVALIVVAISAYFLFVSDGATAPSVQNDPISNEAGATIVYCDEAGNRYNSEAEARAAGLTEAQYGATYCPEYVAAQTGDYRGLTVMQAEEIASAKGEMFRVIKIDGETQATTRDFQEGRINATVEGGIVTEYFAESMDPPAQEGSIITPGLHDAVMGMTIVEAEAYSKANQINLRTGTIDGEGMPLTADFQPGRITVEVKDGVVVGYAVE